MRPGKIIRSWLFAVLKHLKGHHELYIIGFFLLANLFFAGFIYFKVNDLDKRLTDIDFQYIQINDQFSKANENMQAVTSAVMRLQAQMYRARSEDDTVNVDNN